jgi:hypothetical protein
MVAPVGRAENTMRPVVMLVYTEGIFTVWTLELPPALVKDTTFWPDAAELSSAADQLEAKRKEEQHNSGSRKITGVSHSVPPARSTTLPTSSTDVCWLPHLCSFSGPLCCCAVADVVVEVAEKTLMV